MSTARSVLGNAEITSRLITFESENGMRVVGFVDEGREDLWNERVVILAPRYGETKKNSLKLAYMLAANGFKVLRFDQTNHVGESDGTIDQFTLSGAVSDIVGAVRYADGFFEPAEVVLLTVSLSARCGLRACAIEPTISRFVSLVGTVNMDRTLQAIYRRDIFGEFVDGAEWKSIDILGFEIDAANFHGSAVESAMEDLAGSIVDATQTQIPALYLHAERDRWVDLEEVEQVVSVLRKGRLFMIPDVAHEVNENPASARLAFEEIIRFCAHGLDKRIDVIQQPVQKVLLEQNRIEKKRLQKFLSFERSEFEFWGSYLGKFGIIEEAKYYVEYFHFLVEQLGPLEASDVVVDAGCGNGFYGLTLLRSMLISVLGGFELPQPIHYHAVDLTPEGLSSSFARHVKELVDIERESSETGVLSVSYKRMDFDKLPSPGKPKEGEGFPLADGSVAKICSSLVVSYLEKPELLFSEIYRLLRPGGVAIVSSMKPGCDMTVLYHDSIQQNYSEENDREARVLLSAAGEIKLKQEAGTYQFFEKNELERLAFDAGFAKITSCRSFGDQANVVRIVK
ncbi:MAG: methyltransferase domain-containing protein [Opitutaceae bacterium]